MEFSREKKCCWKKVDELGSGYFGTVYLAYSSGSSKYPIAVKSAVYDIPWAIDTLKKEAEIFRRLAGAPNIVKCIGEDTSVENGNLTYNLLLEYAPNGTLSDVIKKTGKIPEIQVAYFASMLLRGLDEIHSRGIIHCDIKPTNILVFPAGVNEASFCQLKIADFGLARFVSEEGSPKSSSDILAIGCNVYMMMMGKVTWEWDGEFASLNLPKKKLSKDGKDFLFRCLNVNPQYRWSAKDLMNHPFIVNNLKTMSEKSGIQLTQDDKVLRNSSTWISERDLFSAT